MFTRTWRFRAAPGREADFEKAYGPDGDWAKLFWHGAGFLGTQLRRTKNEGEYLTIDLWESAEAWETFRRDFSDEYQALDARCDKLTSLEEEVPETKRNQSYETPEITVTFNPNICVHSGVCVRGLPLVFDVRRKRWIQPEHASAADVAAQVSRCPSGALQYRLKAAGDE